MIDNLATNSFIELRGKSWTSEWTQTGALTWSSHFVWILRLPSCRVERDVLEQSEAVHTQQPSWQETRYLQTGRQAKSSCRWAAAHQTEARFGWFLWVTGKPQGQNSPLQPVSLWQCVWPKPSGSRQQSRPLQTQSWRHPEETKREQNMNSRVRETGRILQCRAASHLQREAKRRKSASCWVWARTTRPAATWPQTPELWLLCTLVWLRQWNTQKPQTGSPELEIRQKTSNVTAMMIKWTESFDGMCSTFLFLVTHCLPVYAEKGEAFAPVSHHISYTKCVISWWHLNVLTSSATFSIPLLDLRKVASTSTSGFWVWSSDMMVPTSFEKRQPAVSWNKSFPLSCLGNDC